MAAKQKTRPLDETISGGSYMGVDGSLHDARGEPIKGSGEAESPKTPVEPPAPPAE